MIDQERVHNQYFSDEPKERIKALNQLKGNFPLLPDKQQSWSHLHGLVNDSDSDVRFQLANVLGSVFSQVPDKEQAWGDLKKLMLDENSYVRREAAEALKTVLQHIPNEIQVWDALHKLTFDEDSAIRVTALEVMGITFQNLPDKEEAWGDLHRLTSDLNLYVRREATSTLRSTYQHLPEKQKAWKDLIKLSLDKSRKVRIGAGWALRTVFQYVPDREQAWEDLHRLLSYENSEVRNSIVGILGIIFSYIPDKQIAWNDLHRLSTDRDWDVRYRFIDVICSIFPYVPDKEQAWYDLYRLTTDKNWNVRSKAADSISIIFPYMPNKRRAWDDIYKLANDQESDITKYANHSLGKVSIFKASQAEEENEYRKELENAIRFFEKASQGSGGNNPSQFCLPFYRSFYALTFKKYDLREVDKYLTETRNEIRGSESRKTLYEFVESLSNALKEVNDLEKLNLEIKKRELNFYRKYCDRAAEIIKITEEELPFATKAIRKGLPILDRNLKNLLDEIKEKAKVSLQELKGTGAEEIACSVSSEVARWEISSQEELTINIEKIVSILKSKIPNLQENKQIHDKIESIKNAKNIEEQFEILNTIIQLIPLISTEASVTRSNIDEFILIMERVIERLVLKFNNFDQENVKKYNLFYEQIFEIKERVINLRTIDDNPIKDIDSLYLNVLSTMKELALISTNVDEYEEAIKLYVQILQIREKNLGLYHLETISTMEDLAPLYRDVGDYEKAIDLCNKVYELKEELTKKEVLIDSQTNRKSTIIFLESIACKMITEGNCLNARSHIERIFNFAPEYRPFAQKEFGFLYNFSDPLEKDKERWEKNRELLKKQKDIWCFLSQKNNFTSKNERKSQLREEGKIDDREITNITSLESLKTINYEKNSNSSEKIGEELERAVKELFSLFFITAETDGITLRKLRQQKRGSQDGCDIIVEYEMLSDDKNKEKSSGKKTNLRYKSFSYILEKKEQVKCHVECKNISADLKLSDIAHKLIATNCCFPEIDHWIVISPRAEPSNELERIIPKLEEMFSFKIHIWTPETYARDFFGLHSKMFNSSIYDMFFKPKDFEKHPREWTEEKSREIYEQLKTELRPLSHLPKQWNSYIKNPRFLKINDEVYEELERLYEHYVDLKHMDERRNITGISLEKYVRDWLENKEKRVMFLLGEFGDGKSLFTYVLSRNLINDFNKDPLKGWIPIRFSLKDYYSSGKFDEFLEKRLVTFGANIESWYKLIDYYETKNEKKRILIILDGFDEISESLDSERIIESENVLIDLYNKFSDLKIIITSRTNFFENQKDLEKLLKLLKDNCICHLAPIDKNNVVENLREYLKQHVTTLDPDESLEYLSRLHDPIGLATKPLYLQMIKDVFEELQENGLKNDLSEVELYERYTKRSLKLKQSLLVNSRDRKSLQDVDEICSRLTRILENIALKFLEPEKKYISLIDDFPNNEDQNFAKLLWEISGSEKEREDATLKVGVRSLLIRVKADSSEKWPIDFCHRSMREYFIAKGICEVLKKDCEEAKRLLSVSYLNNEILHFSVEIMKRDNSRIYEEALLKIIESSRKTTLNVGNCATLLYRLKGELPSENWCDLVLDRADFFGANLSGKCFVSTTLREANLYNVNFESSNFIKSDITGARIAETKPVFAIYVHSINKIIVAYGDNTIARWEISQISSPKYEVIGTNESGHIKSIGSIDMYSLLAITDKEAIFFDTDIQEKLVEKSRFRIKDEYKQILSKKNSFLVVSENENAESEVLTIDNQLEIICSKSVKEGSICESLGQDAYVISNCKDSLDIVSTNSTKKTVSLQVCEATSLGVFFCEDSKNYLLACGQRNGEVLVWKIDLSKDEFAFESLFKLPVHEGIVSSVVFIDKRRVATGGFDRKMCILIFDSDSNNAEAVVEAELYLSIRCKEMKIKGMVESKEKELLEELIKRAESK